MHENNLQEETTQPTDNQDFALWQAIFDEGEGRYSVVDQKACLTDLSKPSYDNIPREKLINFRMLTPEGAVIMQIPFKPGTGKRLIWRRRRQVAPGGQETWYYVVGKRGAFVNVIFPDYSILSDDNFNEQNALLNDIQPVKGEEGYEGE